VRLQQETPLLRLHEERSKGQRRKRLRSPQVEALLSELQAASEAQSAAQERLGCRGSMKPVIEQIEDLEDRVETLERDVRRLKMGLKRK
jgi:hypothetical protein